VTKTVLLADDSLTIQRVVELAFAREDVRVVSLGDGEQAIARILESPPDLVLADINMPRRSGYDVADWVRSQPDLSGVPVLLLAGAFETVDAERARAVGAAGILTKPLDPAVLLAKVSALLGEQPGAEMPESDAAAQPLAAAAPVAEPASGAMADAVHDAQPGTGRLPQDQPPVSPAPAADADAYFDEIDRAFSTLVQTPRPPLPPGPEPEFEDESESELSTYLPRPQVPPSAGSPLQDAFATLLDAERTGAVVLPLGRIALSQAAPAMPSIDVNALADQIARRVLQQLSDRVVRETVTDLVSSTTERLVREEIDRIKRNIT